MRRASSIVLIVVLAGLLAAVVTGGLMSRDRPVTPLETLKQRYSGPGLGGYRRVSRRCTNEPCIGTWELDLAKSMFSPEPPPNQPNRTFRNAVGLSTSRGVRALNGSAKRTPS